MTMMKDSVFSQSCSGVLMSFEFSFLSIDAHYRRKQREEGEKNCFSRNENNFTGWNRRGTLANSISGKYNELFKDSESFLFSAVFYHSFSFPTFSFF